MYSQFMMHGQKNIKLNYLGWCKYAFAQRRSRQTTRFLITYPRR